MTDLMAQLREEARAHETKAYAALLASRDAEIAELKLERDELAAKYKRDNHNFRATAALLEAAEARAEVLEKALKPFAKAADSYDPPEGDDDQYLWGRPFITIGDLRRARASLSSPGGEAGK